MKIAVHTKEMENMRIDGTMVYMSHVLYNMQEMIGDDDAFLYHSIPYNEHLKKMTHAHFHERIVSQSPFWTQTQFASALWRDRCDALWMPLHNVPYMRRKNMRTVVTIHDLAFKFFPGTYPTKDRIKLNFFTDHAVKTADAIIAISASTKKDILSFYPQVREQNVHVVHHGFDPQLWQKVFPINDIQEILQKYHVQGQQYIIHVGAVQPRKNLILLIDAFAQIKRTDVDLKLVLVGGDGWLAEKIHEHIANCPYKSDIIVTGNICFEDVNVLMQNASVCALPSLYEGFGIPGLEAMAAGVPVVAANNSCFPEVLGDGAIYFDAQSISDCARSISDVLHDNKRREALITCAQKRAKLFSWKICAQKTLAVIRDDDVTI